MITGSVQIYSDYGTDQEKLLVSDSNLILDGAGELICTMMTIPSDTSALAPNIFDTSNFSVQAISFGKAGLGYFANGHSIDALGSEGRNQNEIWVTQNPKTYNSTDYMHAPTSFSQTAPSPIDEKVTEIPPYYNVIVYPDGDIESNVDTSSGDNLIVAGGVVAWGQNTAGQINVPPNIAELKDIDAGYYHVAAITKNDRVVCWGRNQEGQALPPLGLNDASTIGCGLAHTICSKKDGTITSWGDNSYGQRNLYVTTSSFEIFNNLAITNGHVLALYTKTFDLVGGPYTRTTLKGWGSNSNGQINIPSAVLEGPIPEVAPYNIRFFNAEDSLSLAVRDSTPKELYMWGGNSADPRIEGASFLRYNPISNLNETVSVPWANHYEEVEIGPRHCLALRNKGGSPSAGQIYGGPDDAIVVWGPSGVFTQYPPYDLELGRVVVPGILSSVGQSQIQRIQIVKQQGNTRTENRNRVYFTSTLPNTTYVVQWPQYNTVPPYTPYGYDFFVDSTSAIQDSGYLYLTSQGHVSAFPSFNCGTNPTVPVPTGGSPVWDYSAYITYTPCQHTYLHFSIPPEIQGITTSIFQGVNSDGSLFGVAVTNTTSAVKWGGWNGTVERLGTGFTKVVGNNAANYWKLLKSSGNFLEFPGNLPMDPSGVEIKYNTSASPNNVKKVAAANRYSLGLTVDGIVYSTAQLPIPEAIKAVTVSDISAGELHALVLFPDGTISSFGNNSFGQEDVPAGLSNVFEIAAGYYHNVVRKSDGTVVCWGKNDQGQCDVPFGLVAKKIAAGHSHTTVVDINDQIIVFGRTSEGQASVPEYADTSALDYTFVPRVITAGAFFNAAIYDLTLSSYAQLSDTGLDPSGVLIQTLSTQVYNSLKYGQNVNLIPFANQVIDKIYTTSGVREISLSSQQCLLEGSYAPSTPITLKIVSGEASSPTICETTTVTATGTTGLNALGVVDFRGFIAKKTNGLRQISASPPNGQITYRVSIPAIDTLFADIYGGITSMGLWGFDLRKMFDKNKLPPYIFSRFPTDNVNSVYEDPIDYKLIAKKVYDVNIVRQNSTTSNYFDGRSNLTINWTLNFM
jgi:alpha-tubulin suppressor-like RCC1 family protein